MDTTAANGPITGEHQGGIAPRAIFLAASDLAYEALLVAATEGTTRFVAAAPGDPRLTHDRMQSALRLLSAQCGLSFDSDDVEAVIVRGQPVAALFVGEPDEHDRAALRLIERDGIARIHRPFEMPGRNASRITDWSRRVATAIDSGDFETLIVALPAGVLPVWAAYLFNALAALAASPFRNIVVIGADASIAPALPHGAHWIERNDDLPQVLGDTLLSLRSPFVAADIAVSQRVVSSVQMVASAVAAARHGTEETVMYLDVSDGSTVVIAHSDGIEVLHDAECDAASGAAALLHRIGAEEVARWIPAEVDTAALRGWAIRRVSAPSAMLTDARDRAIASGFARAALRALIARAARPPAPTHCIVGPSLLQFATPSDAMVIVADVLPPSTVVEIAADTDGVLPIVGYFAARSPDSARSLLAHDALTPLGTLLTFSQRDESVVAAVVTGTTRTAIEEHSLTTVNVRAPGAVRIIRRDGREDSIAAHGGPCGILVDTRARPLTRGGSSQGTRVSVSERLRADLAAEGAHDG